MNFLDYNSLIINGRLLRRQEIVDYCRYSEYDNIQKIGCFVSRWLNKSPEIEVTTSGSTGTPKTLRVRKEQMLQSAANTAAYFDFQPGQTALLCLSLDYIAAKMMVVRALFSKLSLICLEPDSSPLSHLPKVTTIDFAPLVPLQLADVLATGGIRRILLGGGITSPTIQETCKVLDADIFHGFGMTETLSHVAVRRLNGRTASPIYWALDGITFEQDGRNCLIINVPFLDEPVHTNDVVDLKNEQSFIWRGRLDHMINSGGMKWYPEEIEQRLFPYIPEPFFIAGLPDERLGEKLCLFIEGAPYDEQQRNNLNKQCILHLKKYENPRDIVFIPRFERTLSGKIQREKTLSGCCRAKAKQDSNRSDS